MASTPQNTGSTHRASIFRGAHKFHIVGYGVPKANKPIRSGDFLAGGHTWALVCGFGDKGDDHLVSITLELVTIGKGEVVALATLRIEDPRGLWPAAVWRSNDCNVFSKTGRSWKLKVPDVFRGHEARYVEDDRLTILCAVDVLEGKEATTTENTNRFLVAVPSSPTISQDLGKLMLMDASSCMPPDVTFVVEQTEIRAHKLVLAMRSSVFAAEFRWHMQFHRGAVCHLIRIEEMSVSTFRAMLRFIYTDELPIKPNKNHVARHPCKEKYAARRCEAMARDLLMAADRYDLERLRLMCEKILSESLDVTTVAMTLQLVCGRHSCRQLEESCIDYIASHPDAYDAVRATEFHDSSSSIIDINDRVLTHRHTSPSTDSSSSGHCILSKESASTHYVSEVVRGAHDFKIPNLNAVQRSHGVSQTVTSGTFKIAGYDWALSVYPSGYSVVTGDQKHYIAVFLELMSVAQVGTTGVRASSCFKMENPSGCASPFVLSSSLKLYDSSGTLSGWGFPKFISMEAAKSKYMANDGSLTIRCEVAVTSEPYTSRTSTVGSRVMVSAVPPSEISTQLGQLLASENGSDVRFLVEKNEMRAHRLVIAARAPSLHEEVVATKNKEDDHATPVVRVDGMKAAVFKAMLHFIYTDELLPGDGTRLLAGDMLTAACRFGLRKLKAMCENLLWESLSKRNVLATAKLAHRHHCKELEDYCIEFASTPDVTKELVNTFIGMED